MQHVRVWDLPLRLFHWLLAAAVIAAMLTGQVGGNLMVWHGRLGILIAGLLGFRLAWGIVGSTHSRFASFVRGPAAIIAYLRGHWHGLGHNPLGALSVLGLLTVLGLQAGGGLFANDDIAFQGPLYGLVSKDTSDWMTGLHRKGFSVMMDDFGSGYSSLNMLKDTNVDAIKLDMKLIDMNQENRSKGVQIVESVVDMAHRLNLPIIAEGVETPEQVSMLQAADCLYSQGYYFFKPMPVENAEKLLADPTNQDYWDLRRDLMRRDRRVENPGTEKTALALQAYQIFTDNVLEISLLNLATGAYRVIKRDARLLDPDLEKEEDFVNYCDRMVNEKIVHEEDTDLFLEQTDLEALRSVLYHATAPEFYRYRENVSGQYIWVTTEVLPCRGCCAQNPWATVLVRNDAQADQLSEELDFSYSHDTLTGLANRSRYEADLRELPNSGYESVVCTYIDVVGMHEVNEHLGHRSGDTLLCCLANAARKFFATSRVYRIGSDEFVILTPNEPPYSVWSTADRMRAFLKEKDYVISVGIQQTADLRHLDEAVAKAEAAMRQDRQAYYDHNGRARQLEGLNEKMERTLQEKRDAEHFLKVLAPKYKTVIVVDLQEDTVRPVIVPDYFQSVLDTCGGSFRAPRSTR